MNYNGYKSAPDTPQIENSIMPTDDLSNTEIRINPSFYIHVLLLDSGKCFLKENAKEGFLQYRLLIEHLQQLCISAKITEETKFLKEVATWEDTNKKYKETQDTLIKGVLIANFKLGKLTKDIFASQTISVPLKDSDKKPPSGGLAKT